MGEMGRGGFGFFSSRRRHTRYWRDWSSDVCSSDLRFRVVLREAGQAEQVSSIHAEAGVCQEFSLLAELGGQGVVKAYLFQFEVRSAESVRSEERRVGKECRSRWSPHP